MGDNDGSKAYDSIVASVAVLTWEPQAQFDWLVANKYPITELGDQFLDIVPSFFEYLRQFNRLDETDEELLTELRDLLQSTERLHKVWSEGRRSLNAPEWNVIREKALEVLGHLEKN